MKITFVKAGGFNLSGGDRVIAMYAKHLKDRGHEVLVLATPPDHPSLFDQLRGLLKGEKLRLKKKKLASHFDNLDIQCQVIDRIRPITDADLPDADVVIATWWETAEWVANLSQAKGAKVYYIQHHEVFEYLPIQRVAATYSLPMHKITVSQWLIDVMRTQYGDHNVSLVLPSVDPEQFCSPPRTKQSIPTVGLIYSTASWKGSDICLKAFSLAKKKVPNLRLVAIGNAANESLPPEFEDGSSTEFIYPVAQNDLKNFYGKCDAWLLGSRSEGFGLPILEAMACRTPVISTPAGAAPELLSDGAGMLVKHEDPQDMALAIERMCKLSNGEWQTMSDAAYAKVQNYTWDDAIELFEAALQTAIKRTKEGEFSAPETLQDVELQPKYI
ncbi:glycosyltransferase family 4 protein [Allocoleopsis sp.]|uniref:glycosyltransferase family 4 protein n=1 Tax=Allocoleopsis sp. TaxID=3088169 RepID=UPI002FD6F743